ncbi:hypothetical protein CCR96_23250 [Halochromatium roseum]|nr:hypothetical protein [Halochromatium roseum]
MGIDLFTDGRLISTQSIDARQLREYQNACWPRFVNLRQGSAIESPESSGCQADCRLQAVSLVR